MSSYSISQLFDISISVLFLLFIGYRILIFITNIRANIFNGNWANLYAKYAISNAFTEYLIWHKVSAQIAVTTYRSTIRLALGKTGAYFQRNFIFSNNDVLFIPYSCFNLEKNTEKGFKIFTVDGIDIWLEEPYAKQIIEKKLINS